jgi:RNA 2',3'-cyclic 3'-phosphodiesterase
LTESYFVAATIPAAIAQEIASLQCAASGVRVFKPEDLHLTLHYLGARDFDAVAKALGGQRWLPPFRLSLDGVAGLPSFGGDVTLCVRVRPCPELLELHGQVLRALDPLGFRLEDRPYTPHISAARCAREAVSRVVHEFLRRNSQFSARNVQITEIALCSSRIVDGIPIYRTERSFPLVPVR